MNGPHKEYDPIPDALNKLGKQIVDAAFKVHKNLGPGLLEKFMKPVCVMSSLRKELKVPGKLKYRLNMMN